MTIGGVITAIEDAYGISKSSLAETQDKEDCLICMGNPVNTMIKPCNHMAMCNECAEILKQKSSICPLCKAKISNFVIISSTKSPNYPPVPN